MQVTPSSDDAMRTIRFYEYGEPAHVLRYERAAIPAPSDGHLRIRVEACGLNPADWALCRGLFAGKLPRGIGLEGSGIVDALGAGVSGVIAGDRVFGPVDFAGYASAGAADFAILSNWAQVPSGLEMVAAAALPMAVATATHALDALEIAAEHTLLINGAGTTVGFAAVQIAVMRGAHVIATAGDTFADRLRAAGAAVTRYGDGIVERVRAISGGPPDFILDTAPVSNALPALVEIAGGNAQRVLTISDFAAAKALGVRINIADDAAPMRYDMLGDFAQRTAEGRFAIPIARTFALDDWRTALEISLSGHARGKLVLVPGS